MKQKVQIRDYFPALPGCMSPFIFSCICSCIVPQFAAAQAPRELADLSLEELGQIRVISVSRQPQELSGTPSAIQVITGDQVRRSGASTIPEALRLASNLQVSQASSQEWIVTARGFSSDVGNKLLVMIDGRSVYTPQFSGVYWERQDYLLADIERIEVISGPGGTLWGPNAVNGVINIITKDAEDTQGLYAQAAGGTELRGLTSVRYGGSLSSEVHYRTYATFSDRDETVFPSGADVDDSWHRAQAGFRIDATPSLADRFTLQGDIYQLQSGVPTGGDADTKGGNILGRWSRQFSERSDMVLQAYYDATDMWLPVPAQDIDGLPVARAGVFEDLLETFDIDFQHGLELGNRHRLLWGAAYRRTHNKVNNAPGLGFLPEHLDQELYSAFVQDEITLVPQRLFLTVGAKIIHNDYTGWENSPSIRLQWNMTREHMLWGAVSRAVRMPSRIDRDLLQPTEPLPPLNLTILRGGPDFESENVTAWEMGYRGQFGSRLTGSISLFYNEYDDIRSASVDPVTVFPLFFENNLEGETYGAEFNFDVQLRDWWRISGGYNLLRHDLRVKPGRFDFNNARNETADPEHQVSLHSSMNLRENMELDIGLRWVDDLEIDDAGDPDTVPAYAELDLRLGWRPSDNVELSLVGRNLLDNQHPEFGVTSPERIEIQRSFHARITLHF